MKRPFGFLNVLILFFCSIYTLQAQTPQEQLIEKFSNYFSIPKEVAYLQLNKTVLLLGEQLGIAAYVVNKSDLKPSVLTSNLYVQIKNSEGIIVREDLLLVENGAASSIYNIDSDFSPGDYTIIAFTNWMRNFEERNYFSEKIKILESSISYNDSKIDSFPNIDAQFLPESGHLLSNVLNHVGVIVKDGQGHGVSHASVVIKDGSDQIIGDVQLNEFGIGKFSFIPQVNENYTAKVIIKDREFGVGFNAEVEQTGVLLSAAQRNSELRLQVHTNTQSLEKIQNKIFLLTVQGRNDIQTFMLQFGERESIPLTLDFTTMDSGINIITLFDEDLLPVAERLVFNFMDLPLENVARPKIAQGIDSLNIKIPFADSKDRKISISVLPAKTLTYNRNQNIISHNLIQPFVRGNIENAGWYFHDIDNRKKYEMDNLLITQGWSSYDWNKIFQSEIVMKHDFEKNLSFEAEINGKQVQKRDQRFIVHATSVNPIDYFVIPKGSNRFIYDGFKLLEEEKLIMSRVKRNNDLLSPDLVIRFLQNKIPDFLYRTEPLGHKIYQIDEAQAITENAFEDDFMKDFVQLKEVELEHKRDLIRERERKLNKSAFSRVHVVTEEDLRKFQTIGDYLKFLNLYVNDYGSTFEVSTLDGKILAIFLDDMLVQDAGIIANLPIYTVDYIDVDKRGVSNRVRFGQGSIMIYSDKVGRHAAVRDINNIEEFDVPIAYRREKTFYTPKYESASDKFFQKFGVIDWKPELNSENGKEISFQIQKPKVDFQLIIEGFTSDGTLIQDVHYYSAE